MHVAVNVQTRGCASWPSATLAVKPTTDARSVQGFGDWDWGQKGLDPLTALGIELAHGIPEVLRQEAEVLGELSGRARLDLSTRKGGHCSTPCHIIHVPKQGSLPLARNPRRWGRELYLSADVVAGLLNCVLTERKGMGETSPSKNLQSREAMGRDQCTRADMCVLTKTLPGGKDYGT